MAVEMYSSSEIDPLFQKVTSLWLTKIDHAKKHKEKVFQTFADECMQFYNGPKNWTSLMTNGSGLGGQDGFPDPVFKVSINKTFEFVTIFGPALYYENPNRTAKPRMPVVLPPQFFPDPMMYQSVMMQENQRITVDGLRGLLLQAMLNWSPNNFDLAGESRQSIDDALITGRGCCWTELYQPPGAKFRVVRTTHEATTALLIDPDARSLRDAKWIARRCIHPVWQVEKDFGLRPGSLKGHTESQDKQSDIETSEDAQYDRKRGLTNDLLIYYKIYSRMGIGGRLQGINDKLRKPLEIFGDFAYIVVAEGVPFLLNLPPDATADPAFGEDPKVIFGRTNWPTPFWATGAGWPVSILDFHSVSGSPWPMAHLKAGIGELKFLNWVMSFMMGKIKNTSRDLIAMKKGLGEEIKTTVLHGQDQELIELEADHGTISELIQILQFPEVNGDVWKMIEAVENNFDKRVGLTELMYGSGGATQIRSAQEAQVRNQNMNVRPDDMARQVESWQSEIAAKEALCLRWHIHGDDVRPILGDLGGMAWDQYVASQDLQTAAYQLEYRIESGSTRRPNKNADIQQIGQAFQALAPVLQAYGQQTMDMAPLNNLLSDYAESLDRDPTRYQLRSVMPPPPPPQPTGEPGSAEEEATTPSGSPPA